MDPIRRFSEALTKNNMPACNKIIDTISERSFYDNINPKMKKGFISLCLRYYIKTDQKSLIRDIIYSTSYLMKRDYLDYCIYIYPSNKIESIKVLKEKIISKEQLLGKDIDLLIKNNCTDLLKELEGYYIKCSYPSHHINYNKLKKFRITNKKDNIINYYKDNIPNYSKFISTLENVDVLLDGGNIIHTGRQVNLKNLEYIINKTFQNYENPLIIIHERHFKKKTPENILFLKKYKEFVFMTPYNVYDDYYQILGMIYNDIPIITNDLFRDHIFDMFKMFDSKNNQIKHYIESMCLSYGKKIKPYRKYSFCIQYDENNIYIPTENNFYSFKI
uniref:Uncharacterized protein n=1 Tax=viral metagenome TaxID=1070528 RepID=A0A6C0J3H0_9ZZZZ